MCGGGGGGEYDRQQKCLNETPAPNNNSTERMTRPRFENVVKEESSGSNMMSGLTGVRSAAFLM